MTGAVPEGEPTTNVEFEICEGDVDFFSFGHMGGNVDVSYSLTDEAGTVAGEIFKVKRTGDADTGYTYETGDSMGELPFDDQVLEYLEGVLSWVLRLTVR